MEGSKNIGNQSVSPQSEGASVSFPSSPEGQSRGKKVSASSATRYLPREWLFGDSPISSPYRYRTAALPKEKPTRIAKSQLSQDVKIHLEQLKRTLNIKKNHLAILSGNHYLYNWLIFQARQIEQDFESGQPARMEKARNLAACIDETCSTRGFNWRNLTLSPNYQALGSKKERDKANRLFPEDIEEKEFQTAKTHVFLPPWMDTMVGNYPMAQIYDAYWEIRQRLGDRSLKTRFYKEDFAALFSPIVEWLKEFEAQTTGHSDLHPDHIEAFKYLLDECDRYPNSVKDKPKWTWRELLAIDKPEDCEASPDILDIAQKEERIAALREQINPEESESGSDTSELNVSIKRSHLQGKFAPDPELMEQSSSLITSGIDVEEMETEASLTSSQTPFFEGRPVSHQTHMGWQRTREKLLPLNPDLKLQCSEIDLKRYFSGTAERMEYKGKLDLDTYEFMALPMNCVKELLKKYDKRSSAKAEWIAPRAETLNQVFEVIDKRLDELMQMTGKKLTAMQKSGEARMFGNEIYSQFCSSIDKIKLQYNSYHAMVKAFCQAVGTPREAECRQMMEQSMTGPEGWVLQALMSDREWQDLLDSGDYSENS